MSREFNLGRNIKILRIKRDMRQGLLARDADISQSRLSLIENNKVSPSLRTLQKIVDVLDVSMRDLFTEDN